MIKLRKLKLAVLTFGTMFLALGLALFGLAAPSSDAAGATGTAFKLGVLTTATGVQSSSTNDVDATMKAWASYVNSHGGIDGHDVQLVFGDDQGTPSIGLSEAQKLVHDGVIAFVGGLSTAAFAWSSYVESAKIPVIGGPAVGSGFTAAQSVYYPSATDYASAIGTMFMAVSKHLKTGRIAVGYCAEVPACATVPTNTSKAIKDDHLTNLTLAYQTSLSATAPSYTSECLAAKEANTNTLYIGDAFTVASQFLTQCAAQGYKPALASDTENIYGEYLTNPTFNKSVGSIDDFPWWDSSHPGVSAFLNAMKTSHVSWQANPASAAEAWSAGEVFAAAVKQGHLGANATPAQLAAALNTFNKQTVGGLLPPLTYTHGNRTEPCGYAYEALNGHWQFPTGVGSQLLCSS